MLHLLVADGNDREGRARRAQATGENSAEAYAGILREVAPDAVCTLVEPADSDAGLPPGEGLGGFDGVVFTGSTLHVTDDLPAVRRQIELMRVCLDSGLPVFGSCWGVQVAAAIAGGRTGRNPRGPEYGFARDLSPTPAGLAHPLLAGRPSSYDAPAMHLDAVIEPPPGAVVLAGNALLDVQAIEIRHGAGLFWGTQYHPELDLDDLAAMLRLSAGEVVEAGVRPDAAAVGAYADELCRIAEAPEGSPELTQRHELGPEILEDARRRREITNFLDVLVRPRAQAMR
ncbi:type 1 glutamine amidotransferase [Methylobacterium iners]|uniref:Gamma-glutamyl-L-1-hydroxyisopropylamide hydrolase n=1 Tax=Methylobacterium iners TaxID=418707 RepID=A0ABQ4RR85_9HYPH|nr:type 1 glutamine amidotransferase [Methylobacterium iners]GJD93291.1 Gamma-glutamyl-L-1-hydroxyisopropylamide hydrolase [Methylobacterium iners]